MSDSDANTDVTTAAPSAPGEPARGTLFVISAPSGAGKTSLVQAMVARDSALQVSVSHTTRPSRPGERDGVNYHFVEREVFERMLAEGAFLEHAEVFGNLYGTAEQWVGGQLDAGIDVILEIDWQGAAQVRSKLVETVGIFILPPSVETLRSRLTNRRQDDEGVIRERLAKAAEEISHYAEYDYLVVNDDFETATGDLLAIVRAERLRRTRQRRRLLPLVESLLSSGESPL